MSRIVLFFKIIWYSRELRVLAPLIQQALEWYIKSPTTPSNERHEEALAMMKKISPEQPQPTNTSTDLPATPPDGA